MNVEFLKNKNVGILGYGIEGVAVTKFLLKHGITPVLFDEKPWEKWSKEKQEEIKNLKINFIFGENAFLELYGFDIVFRSPGIKLEKISEKKLLVTSQTKFFFDNCPCKIIGVTGTKGKGTTSTLIYNILQENVFNHNSKNYLTGNIGYIQPLEILDSLNPNDLIVYELSSFQLQDLEKSPHIAVVLMITSEHLDYHKSINDYTNAKSNITRFQNIGDIAIINEDYEASKKIGTLGNAHKDFISAKKNKPDISNYIPFIQLKGKHNLENICASVALAKHLNINSDVIKKAIVKFKGLEHRLEFVCEKNGVKFYNDSFSTTPETAISAINSFNEPLNLILGGSSKKSNFNELGALIAQKTNIKNLILIGHEAENIKSAINLRKNSNSIILTGAQSMAEIFKQIKTITKPGDVVLLSPACASFDMFNDYIDRGKQFKLFANNLNEN